MAFVKFNSAKSPQEQAAIDQASSELRDQLHRMGLDIKTPEQFHTAVIISTAVALNMSKLTEMGIPTRTAEDVAALSIAALRPDSV